MTTCRKPLCYSVRNSELPKKRLEEWNRVSKEERKKAEQNKFDKIPQMVLQNGMFQRMVKRVHEIQDLGC
jgi:hypothetical protein